MITANDKIRIFKKILPFGFIYENDEQRSKLFFEDNDGYYLPTELQRDFNTNDEFINTVENLHRQNRNSFIYKAVRLNKTDFLNFIEEQFYLTKNKNESCVSYWLESIYHYFVKEQNVFEFQEELNEKRGAFIKWYNTIKKTIPVEASNVEKKLKVNVIALKLVYENISVTKENADEIIIKYGHKSGHKLYQHFNFYYQRANRIADPDKTKKILENKIKLFESVIDLVPAEKKIQVTDECNTLRAYLAKH